MEIRRRDFIKLFGGLSGGALLGSYGVDPMFAVPKQLLDRATFGPRTESWKNTICRLCPGGCGMKVRAINDVPIAVKGNPLNPINRGGMCPLGLNSLHSLYHPDRIQGPLERTGIPGSHSWKALSWDDALGTVAEKLRELREAGSSHHAVFLGSDEQGVMQSHISKFMTAFGSPNTFRFSSDESKDAGYVLTMGTPKIPSPDIVNSRLVVSFGSNFLEEGPSPIYFTKLYSRHDEQDTKYIQIDVRLNRTAANADSWIPIKPGTYGALALGVAYVLIREELYDTSFVRQSTFGFEDWVDGNGIRHSGFKSLVLGEYYPEKVQEITGVPSAKILELGRELGNTRPSVALCDQGAIDHTNGTFTIMAVNAVNALLGNYESDGGFYFIDDVPLSDLGQFKTDAQARRSLAEPTVGQSADGAFPLSSFTMESFIQNALDGTPYPIEVLFIKGGNPLFQTIHQKTLAQALQRIPLVVSFDSMMSETSEYADIVLPEHHFMEQWDAVSHVESVGFTHVGIQQPIVQPLYDTRHVGDVLIDLAQRIGGNVSKAFRYGSYEEGLRLSLKGVYDSRVGAITAEGTGRRWLEFLNQRGWRNDRHSSFDDFWTRLTKYAGWWNPIRKKKNLRSVFRTPSRKFEFHSQVLENIVEKTMKGDSENRTKEQVLKNIGISAGGDTAFLPHYEPVSSEGGDLPLQLISFRLMSVGDGRGASLPMMQELFGHAVNRHWDSWAQIHPTTADQYKIIDGEWMLVYSPQGSLRIRSKISKGIIPGVVAIPFGLGHTSGGRYARDHGVNPHAVMKGLQDRLSGRESRHATRVRIAAE
jgi:anaerobic selenocysteine-containing dehydrogenase